MSAGRQVREQKEDRQHESDFKRPARWTLNIPYLLSVITWLPAVGALVVLFLFNKGQSATIKRFATAWFALDFLASLALLGYDRGAGGFQFLEDAQWIPVIGARYQMG